MHLQDDWIFWGYALKRPEEYELMQCADLQDKNGKEIYEGDVLRGMYGEQQKEPLNELLGKVVFSRGSFEVRFGVTRRSLDEIDGNFAIYWCDHGHMNIPNYYYRIEDIEVIGNIYETPDLLK